MYPGTAFTRSIGDAGVWFVDIAVCIVQEADILFCGSQAACTLALLSPAALATQVCAVHDCFKNKKGRRSTLVVDSPSGTSSVGHSIIVCSWFHLFCLASAG
jgi:hypothetical protein